MPSYAITLARTVTITTNVIVEAPSDYDARGIAIDSTCASDRWTEIHESEPFVVTCEEVGQ